MSVAFQGWIRPADAVPDAEATVLMLTRDDDLPVFLGAYEGDGQWIDVHGATVDSQVLGWIPLEEAEMWPFRGSALEEVLP